MNYAVIDVVKDTFGKLPQISLFVDWEISGKKKRCFKKLCNISIAKPEENHGNTNDDQVTAVAHATYPNPKKFGDRDQDDIIPVNPILESWGEDRTATQLSTTAHGLIG